MKLLIWALGLIWICPLPTERTSVSWYYQLMRILTGIPSSKHEPVGQGAVSSESAHTDS